MLFYGYLNKVGWVVSAAHVFWYDVVFVINSHADAPSKR
jgi:hypothetical protein